MLITITQSEYDSELERVRKTPLGICRNYNLKVRYYLCELAVSKATGIERGVGGLSGSDLVGGDEAKGWSVVNWSTYDAPNLKATDYHAYTTKGCNVWWVKIHNDLTYEVVGYTHTDDMTDWVRNWRGDYVSPSGEGCIIRAF